MKVITFFNNKGGVGKTTLGVNIAAYFALEMNKRILVLDGDPQANTTQMVVSEDEWDLLYGDKKEVLTLQDYLTPITQGDSDIDVSKLKPYPAEINRFGVDLIPGDPRISIIEDILSDAWNKCISGSIEGFRKSNWLRSIKDYYNESYDVLFIDVGPSLGALNRSILLNSDYIITPMGSDIFSLMAIKNISTWVTGWKADYENGLNLMHRKGIPFDSFSLNMNVQDSTNLIGYSVQQYITKTIKGVRRPIKSYEAIINQIPKVMEESLRELIPEDLTDDAINLGDIPYFYSLVPLAQSNNSPIFELNGSDGVSGLQYGHVTQYKEIISNICEKVSRNMELVK